MKVEKVSGVMDDINITAWTSYGQHFVTVVSRDTALEIFHGLRKMLWPAQHPTPPSWSVETRKCVAAGLELRAQMLQAGIGVTARIYIHGKMSGKPFAGRWRAARLLLHWAQCVRSNRIPL